MELSQKFKIDKDNVAYRVVSGKGVILNLETNHYYTLNGVGTQIWEWMNKGKTFGEILSALKKDYSVPEDELKKDLLGLISDLKKEKLIWK